MPLSSAASTARPDAVDPCSDCHRCPPAQRCTVEESWRRSIEAGLDADRLDVPFVCERTDLIAIRAEHPLSHVVPLLRDVADRIAGESNCVIAMGDEQGRLLWVQGGPAALRRLESSIGFTEGTLWSEGAVGTNAIGTALHTNEPVLIRRQEHFARQVQRYSCAAAPVRDPDTARPVGFIDITGGASAGSALALGMVASAARMAEAELRRLVTLGTPLSGSASKTPQALRLTCLGRPDCEVAWGDRTLRLSPRHSEILAVLADSEVGLTGDQLAYEVYHSEAPTSTMRAEIVRLRSLLGPDLLDSRPYRLRVDVRSDWHDVRRALRAGRLQEALSRYAGPLLPQSDAPGIVERREAMDKDLRLAILGCEDPETLLTWSRSRWGSDDLQAWERVVMALPAGSAMQGAAAAEVRRLRRTYGLDPTGRLERPLQQPALRRLDPVAGVQR